MPTETWILNLSQAHTNNQLVLLIVHVKPHWFKVRESQDDYTNQQSLINYTLIKINERLPWIEFFSSRSDFEWVCVFYLRFTTLSKTLCQVPSAGSRAWNDFITYLQSLFQSTSDEYRVLKLGRAGKIPTWFYFKSLFSLPPSVSHFIVNSLPGTELEISCQTNQWFLIALVLYISCTSFLLGKSAQIVSACAKERHYCIQWL